MSSWRSPRSSSSQQQNLTFSPTKPTIIDEENPLLGNAPPPPPAHFSSGLHHRRYSSTVPLSTGNIPRFVKRNLPNYQSKQKVSIENRHAENVRPLKYKNWFHVFLRWETKKSLTLLVLAWTLINLGFGLIYRAIDSIDPNKDCGLASQPGKVIGLPGAFAFSLETCTTVGYGLPGGHNGFFENCPLLQLAIYTQMVYSMLFNAFLFAFFFARLARAEARGAQMLFSNKAIIEHRNGKWLFHARIYDLDAAHPVVEAHVRLYVISWMDYEYQDFNKQPHLLHTMRLLQPNDDLGGMLFTSVPATLTHHIDAYSPLTPSYLRDDDSLVQRHGLPLREVDRMVENMGGIPCPICGETYGTHVNLQRHIQYNAMMEAADPNVPVQGSHQTLVNTMPPSQPLEKMSEQEIRNSLQDKEIMVVCEGIEPLISGTFQALQSYTTDDIVFGGKFAPCMSQKEGQIFIDLNKFHQIVPATPGSSFRRKGGPRIL
ncbi:rectifier potassium channel 2 [Seminavis robusta]|uniref:Rectifier potassium channel 2 n=1 Tax=Seminavis robusta TaxID=568900 RepID=A0A9N8EKE7_9STRA|nr:rectifier potassium channel 2 [Seminavis robusta]|eukprot:Sro1106_g242030.1 rectifier potassium channel 2 (486) ;mRNA; f:22167-23624